MTTRTTPRPRHKPTMGCAGQPQPDGGDTEQTEPLPAPPAPPVIARHRRPAYRPTVFQLLIGIGAALTALAVVAALLLLAMDTPAHAGPPPASTAVAGGACAPTGRVYQEEGRTFVCADLPGNTGPVWQPRPGGCGYCNPKPPCHQCGPQHSPSPAVSMSPDVSPSPDMSPSPDTSPSPGESPAGSPSPDMTLPSDDTTPPDVGLPNTGSPLGVILIVGGLLLGLGVPMVLIGSGRRRRMSGS